MIKDRQKASVINMQSAIEEEARADSANLTLLEKPKINHATWQTPEEAKLENNRVSSDLQSTTSEAQGKKIRIVSIRAGAAGVLPLREGGLASSREAGLLGRRRDDGEGGGGRLGEEAR